MSSQSPNQISVSESGRRILNTVKDELFPLIEKVKDILVRIQKCRISFQLYSWELNKLENEYTNVSSEFFAVVRKLQTPDILFEGLSNATQNIVEYFKYQNAFQDNITQGLNYIEIIDRTLDRKSQIIQNTRIFLVSIVAILVSILSFLKRYC